MSSTSGPGSRGTAGKREVPPGPAAGDEQMDESIDNEPYPRVTAALIISRGRFFIARRPAHKSFGLCWEFPGGKVEPGESLEQSLVREIREELCWEIGVRELFQRVRHRSEGFSIELYAFWCEILGGEMCLKEHIAFEWVRPDEMSSFAFTHADRELARLLALLPSVSG